MQNIRCYDEYPVFNQRRMSESEMAIRSYARITISRTHRALVEYQIFITTTDIFHNGCSIIVTRYYVLVLTDQLLETTASSAQS